MNVALPFRSVFKMLGEARVAAFIYMSCMFATGASGYVCEMLLAHVSSILFENTIVAYSIVIGIFVVSMGISTQIQSVLSEKRLTGWFLTVEMTISVLCGYTPLILYSVYAFSEMHSFVLQYALACSIGFLTGFEIPIVMRLYKQYAGSLSTNIKRIISSDYIGVGFGVALWLYLLYEGIPITEISFLVAGLNVTVALLALLFFCKFDLIKRKKIWVLIWCLTIASLGAGYKYNQTWSLPLKQKFWDDKIVLDVQTVFQNIVVTFRKETNDYRMYSNGQIQFSSKDEARYHEPLVHPVMSLVKEKKHVLVLGGGDGMAVRELLKYKGIESITLIELDPKMIELFRDNGVLAKLNDYAFGDPRVRVLKSGGITPGEITPVKMSTGKENEAGLQIMERVAWVNVMNIDAHKYVERARSQWDVIIIDFPDPGNIQLNKLYTHEFYLKLKRILSRDGMVVIQATSPYYAKETFLGINRTIKSAGFNALPFRNEVPSFAGWGWILFFKNHISSESVLERIHEMKFEVETSFLVERQAEGFFYNWGKGELESEHDWINKYDEPKLLWTYLTESWLVD